MAMSPRESRASSPGDPNWLYNIPLEMEITSEGKIKLDFDGTQPWGFHSMNCTPAGMDGGMFVTLTST